MLNIEQITALKNSAQQRIDELFDEVNSEQTPLTDDDQDAKLDELISQTVQMNLTNSHKIELQQLKHFLKWLETEDAGYCSLCGDDIPYARLEAVLGVTRCVECAK